MNDERREALRARLEARAAEFAEAERSSADERRPVELDQQSVGRLSRMDAMQVQAMSNAQSRRRATELRRIQAALKRWKDGEYGYCAECGDEIAEKRLDLDPATPLCIDCASGR